MKDEGLKAAFQTDNLESLRRQKFSASLEDALIASASDFYGVLNRMYEQPDFKRLFEEFVLGEFRQGLAVNEAAGASVETESADVISQTAERYLRRHFGEAPKWAAINQTVWQTIQTKPDAVFRLSDIASVAAVASVEFDEVLAALALLARPSAHFLKMEYLRNTDGGQVEVLPEEVGQKVRAWWKTKALSDEDWQAWAANTRVQWTPLAGKEAAR